MLKHEILSFLKILDLDLNIDIKLHNKDFKQFTKKLKF